MSNFDYLNYKGNAIFRNQPNHKYFDKPFEDEQDCFFHFLNEIDLLFLKPEQQAENLNNCNIIVRDPRTRQPVTQLCYDHTVEEKLKMFCSNKKSLLTIKQHKLGLRVLSALQEFRAVDEEDMYNWHRLQNMRQKENQYFQKYVLEFNQSGKEKMYKPCRKLLELYQKWYKSKITRLMKRYPDRSYNTHLGLPQVKQYKNVLSNMQVEIKQQETVSKLGDKCFWHEGIKSELKKFNNSITTYAEIYTNSEDLKDFLEGSLQSSFESLMEREATDYPLFYIPLESLLFLVTAGDYVDISSEMLLDIKEKELPGGDTRKYIIMDQPLPSRQSGWHVYQQLIQQAATAVVATKQSGVEADDFSQLAVSLKNPFKVITIEDFMQKSKLNAEKLCKFSKVLTRWQLGMMDDTDNTQEIYSTLDVFTENKELSIKLEFKPVFGCEVLTKYDMLKQWFKLKLQPTRSSSCIRLDVNNYQTLLEEQMSLHKLEENLHSVYHVNCKQLLNNLYEFLKLLYEMPIGHYMLRYNPKYMDKLMLCKPDEEITSNTIHLHQLLQCDVTDIQFMSQTVFLPIDENLCSLIHLQNDTLPGAFCPREDMEKISNKSRPSPQQERLVQHKEVKRGINKIKMKRIRRRLRLFEAMKVNKDELT